MFPISITSAAVDVKANVGILDLQNWNFEQNGAVKLRGEWGIYWNESLIPTGEPTTFVDFPHMWLGSRVNGELLSGHGLGTYSLKIQLSEDTLGTPKAIHLPLISGASKLWVNGLLVKEIGTIGTSLDTEYPAYDPEVIYIDANQTEINLVLQVSNFSERKGGIWNDLLFGNAEDLASQIEQRYIQEMFLIGALSIFGVYHIIMYLLRRTEKSALAFGLLCLLISVRTMVVGEVLLTEFLPAISWELLKKIEYWTISLGIPIFVMFLHFIFPKYIHKKALNSLLTISILYSLFVLCTPARLFTQTINFYQIIILLTMFYVLAVFIKALRKNEPGVKILFGSTIIFTITVINDILYYNEWIDKGDYTGLGLFIFIVAQSITLAINYAATYHKLESTSTKLIELNNTLEEKVKVRTYELEHSQMELEKANQMLEKLSNIDSLTNVPNRRSLNRKFETVWGSAKQTDHLLTVFMIDIDCFKLFNDTYGHQLGDNALKAVAGALQSETEKSDGFLARYGGEEFFVLFEGKSYDEGVKIAKSLNLFIFDLNIKHATSTVSDRVTISIGIAQLMVSEEINPEELLKRADKALYGSKEAGRNTVSYYKDLDSLEFL